MKFQTGNGTSLTLAEGKTYKAIYHRELAQPVIATLVPGAKDKKTELPGQGSPTAVPAN